jgi:2-polyprenyl-3-methyl-5-hydroxy-6-metoxy-1,4-benzoquinol methylase
LEVGCGHGYLLDEAAGYFQERVGCDLAPSAVATVQSADAVYVGGPEAIPLEKRFDCIIATHVIEHVYEPLRFVQDLTRRLRDGGWLVLAAPDMSSFWRRLMGRRWPSF